jgi:hypothetical protein
MRLGEKAVTSGRKIAVPGCDEVLGLLLDL